MTQERIPRGLNPGQFKLDYITFLAGGGFGGKLKTLFFVIPLSCLLLWSPPANAHSSCKKIRFSDVGWTDNTANTAVASVLFDSLGYSTKTMRLSVPVTYASLKNKDIDVFLGNWMPSMAAQIEPYQKDGSVETIGAILKGAHYTLAVPTYVYEAGVRSIADLSPHQDKFKNKIFGIEAGNDGNRLIQKMISDGALGNKNWKLVETGEQAMLMEIFRAIRRKEWVVFLGWEPHPMNRKAQISYLSADKYFGPNHGKATVYINTRKNYSSDCPEVGKLLKKLSFSMEDENQLMDLILEKGLDPKAAAKIWISSHPNVVNAWLAGVKTADGQDALLGSKENLSLDILRHR
jgi:glycine betaine/proline transport system substrate-binding protein